MFVLLTGGRVWQALADLSGAYDAPMRKLRFAGRRWSAEKFAVSMHGLTGLVFLTVVAFAAYWLITGAARGVRYPWGGGLLGVTGAAAIFLPLFAAWIWLLGADVELEDGDDPFTMVGPHHLRRYALRNAAWSTLIGGICGAIFVATWTMVATVYDVLPAALRHEGRTPEELLETLHHAAAGGAAHIVRFAVSLAVVVFVVRLALYPENRITSRVLADQCRVPHDYPAFLRLAARLSLLQRHGGGEYTFVHQLVRDYFADTEKSHNAEARAAVERSSPVRDESGSTRDRIDGVNDDGRRFRSKPPSFRERTHARVQSSISC